MTPRRCARFLATFVVLGLAACGAAEAPRPPAPVATPGGPRVVVTPVPTDALTASPYPATRRGPEKDTLHGVDVLDPYRWLEDATSTDVQAWMGKEDGYARTELARSPDRDAIATRLRELFYVDSVGLPFHRGTKYFFTRREATKEKGVVYWKEGKTAAEKVLLDPNAWPAERHIALGGWWPSWDGKTVAYKTKENNGDEATLYVMDVASGKKSEIDVIDGAKYAGASWTPKGDGFYYTWLPTDPSIPTAERPGYAEIRFHKLGQDPKKDALIHERTGDAKSFLQASITKDGHWLVMTIQHGWTRSDIYFKDLRKVPDDGFKPLITGVDAEFDVDEYQDRFYVLTNDGAPHYRVFKVDPSKASRAGWKEIVAERQEATLNGQAIVGGKLSISYLKDVIGHIEVRDLEGKMLREVALPAAGSTSSLVGREDEDEAYFSFTSFTFPTEIYETSAKSGETKLWHRLKLPVDPSKYAVEQEFFTSKDGTRIPMFIVHAKDQPKDGKAPLLLYGYGGFNAAQTPTFRASMFPWLERGGVYAIANLRGGSEYGDAWHRAGMRTKKQNVFDDFIGAAEHVIKEKYTSADRLVSLGGSNGGLLVGAAMIARPDLFRVVLCDVPLLDMVRYHRFGSGKTWVEEYGSADDSAEDFKAIYAYSPYHHVTKGTKYPSVLMLSADSDDRVDPLHARKFAAALQYASSGGPVLLRIEKNAGHGGADMVKASVEKIADEYAFALSQIDRAAR